MAVNLSALRAGRALLSRNIFLLLVLISVRLIKPQGLVRPERFGKLKKFIHLFGSQTRDLPAFSIVPKPLCYRVPPINLYILLIFNALF
jgi:hypothetical protein